MVFLKTAVAHAGQGMPAETLTSRTLATGLWNAPSRRPSSSRSSSNECSNPGGMWRHEAFQDGRRPVQSEFKRYNVTLTNAATRRLRDLPLGRSPPIAQVLSKFAFPADR